MEILSQLSHADQKTIYSIISVSFAVLAFIPAFIETWTIKDQYDVRPTISGWLSWVASDIAILSAMIVRDDISWQMVPYVFGSSILIILALRKGWKIARIRGESTSWKDPFMDWNHKDTTCIGIVAVAIVVWSISHDPDYAIYLTAISATIGAFAIWVPLMADPYREPLNAWVLFLVGGVFGLAAVNEWTLAGALIPVMCFVVQTTMVTLTARRFLPRFARA